MKIFLNEITDKVIDKENARDLNLSAQNISNVATNEMVQNLEFFTPSSLRIFKHTFTSR